MLEAMKWPRKAFPSCEIQVWAVGLREFGLGYLVSSTFWGKKLLIPAQGGWYSPEHQGQSSQSSASYHSSWGAGALCRKKHGCQMLSQSARNLQVNLMSQHCLLGWSQGCPWRTGREYVSDEIGQAIGGHTVWRTMGSAVGLAMAWVVVVQLPAWSAVPCTWTCCSRMTGGVWGFLCFWNFCHLTGECCIVVAGSLCTCTGQCNDLGCHTQSRTVPGLGTDLGWE